MSKKAVQKQVKKDAVSMPLVNPFSAGIDIGDKIHAVAVPEGFAQERVRVFGTMTCDLLEIVSWLKECNVVTVAMESTGIYWKPLFALLVREGFEVHLVNSRHVKNVSGRKNDEDDAMWIQKLHSCGLLKSSYLPDDEQESLRELVRFRRTVVQGSSSYVQRMQKTFEQMNIKLHTVISDITGKTGRLILDAIMAGERKAENFLPLLDKRIKASDEVIKKSLEGNWREEHIMILRQSYEFYKYHLGQIAELDKEIEKRLVCYEAKSNLGEIKDLDPTKKDAVPEKKYKKKNKHMPIFNVRQYLTKIHGVDVLAIYGLSDMSGLELLAETGTDMGKWETEKHFVSWLNLCPNNKISGGKLISSQLMKKKANRASQAFRAAANSVQKSDNWLGDYFRRKKAIHGNKYAITATANKIATIYYKMIRYKKEFQPVDMSTYQKKNREKRIEYFENKIKQLKEGLALEVA